MKQYIQPVNNITPIVSLTQLMAISSAPEVSTNVGINYLKNSNDLSNAI